MIPVGYSVDVLAELASAHDLDITVEILDGAAHSVLHHPRLFPAISEWLCGASNAPAC